MNDSPIRRKMTNYPVDFLPSAHKQKQDKRFTFNQDYQIQAQRIKKYEKCIEDAPILCQICSRVTTTVANPEQNVLSITELQQDHPLSYHLIGKRPHLDDDLLKKPRFSLNDKQQINQNYGNTLENSMSPGCIKKQLADRQAPLPAEDPCKIQLIKPSPGKNTKIANSYLKYRSTGQFDSRRWLSSQKDIMQKFKASRSKVQELPMVKKKGHQNQAQFSAAKEQYESFRRKQDSMNGGFGKVNSLLSSMKKKDDRMSATELPSFDKTAVERLKEEINTTVRMKKGCEKKDSEYSSSSESQQQLVENNIYRQRHQSHRKSKNMHFPVRNVLDNRPELLVSYRSSLPFLKDLYNKSLNLQIYHLVVKIPKLFIQNLIKKGQDRQDLYETARNIFYQLKIPHQNLIIKKYTNCTMLIARNICMIWHFDGRRFLGGWQSQYLDQGFKHGLGLEWQPKKYVYYGQYVKNKKHGLGIYKDKTGINYIGYWSKGQRCDKNDLHLSAVDQYNEYYIQNSEEEDASGEPNVYQYL